MRPIISITRSPEPLTTALLHREALAAPSMRHIPLNDIELSFLIQFVWQSKILGDRFLPKFARHLKTCENKGHLEKFEMESIFNEVLQNLLDKLEAIDPPFFNELTEAFLSICDDSNRDMIQFVSMLCKEYPDSEAQ